MKSSNSVAPKTLPIVAWSKRQTIYTGLTILLGVILVDDSLQIHEDAGA